MFWIHYSRRGIRIGRMVDGREGPVVIAAAVPSVTVDQEAGWKLLTLEVSGDLGPGVKEYHATDKRLLEARIIEFFGLIGYPSRDWMGEARSMLRQL
jgi:hypothetical protein